MGGHADEVKTKLKQAGCRFDRQGKGDHEIWLSPVTGKRFPVDQGIKSRHTANAIMKQAGIAFRFDEMPYLVVSASRVPPPPAL